MTQYDWKEVAKEYQISEDETLYLVPEMCQEICQLRAALNISIESLRLIDMRKEGFEEDLVLCPQIAYEALKELDRLCVM